MLFDSNDELTKEDFLNNIKNDIQDSDYRKEIEEGKEIRVVERRSWRR